MEPLLTTKELAKMLHVSLATIYRMVKRGELPCTRVGKQYRFRPEEVRKAVRG